MDNTVLYLANGYSHAEVEEKMNVADEPDGTPMSVILATPAEVDDTALYLHDECETRNASALQQYGDEHRAATAAEQAFCEESLGTESD